MAAPKEYHVICNVQSAGLGLAPVTVTTEAEAQKLCAGIKESVTVYGPAQKGTIVCIWAETAEMAAAWAKYGLGLQPTGVGVPMKVPLTNAENASKPMVTAIEATYKQEGAL